MTFKSAGLYLSHFYGSLCNLLLVSQFGPFSFVLQWLFLLCFTQFLVAEFAKSRDNVP